MPAILIMNLLDSKPAPSANDFKRCLKCTNLADGNSSYCFPCNLLMREQSILNSETGVNSLACPACQSQNTQSFEMAYNQGVSSGTIVGNSYNLHYGFSLLGAKTKNRNMLSYKVQPPLPGKTFQSFYAVLLLLGLMILPAFVVIMMERLGNNEALTPIFIACLVLAIFVGIVYVRDVKKARNIKAHYQEDYELWQCSYICLRCGHCWMRHNA